MSNLLRLFALFKPDAPWLLLGVVAAIFSLSFSLLVFGSIALLFSGLAAAGVLRSSAPGRILARYTERLVTHNATFRVLARLRLWLFARLIPLAPLQLGLRRGGDLLSRLTSDIDALDGFYLRLLLPLFLALGTAGFALWWLAQHDGAAALLVLVLLVGYVVVLFIIARTSAAHSASIIHAQGELRTDIIDGVEGLAELLASGAGYQQASVIARQSSSLVRDQLAAGRAASLAGMATQLLQGGLLLVLLSSSLQSQAMMIAVLASVVLAEVLGGLQGAFLAAPRLAAASARLFELADTRPLVAEPETPQPIPTDLSISLEKASFSYDRSAPVLSDVSLSIKPGERVAIMGTSGAGKSSLALLLLKFAEPAQGQITLGGVPLTRLEGDVWRTRIGYLSQNTHLLTGTITDNLRLAKPDASEADMLTALEAVELASFVRSLPDGINTWLGEDGLQVSGGQARRLALAMVLLKNAPLWLLDEPTEGLDAATAEAVLTTIRRLTDGRTLLIITHDEAMLQPLGLTRLLLLENGKITADNAL